MLKWLKSCLSKYDAWCLSMGLTPENKRSCVPYKTDPYCTEPISNRSSSSKANKEIDK